MAVTAIASGTENQALRDLLNQIHDEIVAIRNTLGNVLVGSATYDAANLVDAAGVTTTITVTGAALGDYVLCSAGVDLQGISMTAYVSAADTVSIRLQNESGGALDLASTTFRVLVIPKAAVALAAKVLTKT